MNQMYPNYWSQYQYFLDIFYKYYSYQLNEIFYTYSTFL